MAASAKGAHEHRASQAYWQQVFFSDESRLNLWDHDGPIRVRRYAGLDTAVETVATVSMQIAAKEAKYVSGYSDIPVAIDGIWQTHGHTSLNNAVIATSFYTGKVLDASIL
ncbi:hypothetical protein TNCV_3163301 [Trichonephila clavipes]|nr:hypothetical protein TNCV_3163301 [Trichonephila clavipes]